ncbi:MAG: hypothetical protein ACXWLM_08135, partial [Myxococcales bacterium]
MRPFALLFTLCFACGGVDPDAVQTDLSSFPVDTYPAKCGVSLIESFEGSLAPWHAANWAGATLGMPVSSTAAGATRGAKALSIGVRFTGAGYEQGYVGREGLSLSFAGCASIAVDVTLPPGAPSGLRGSLVLLLGPDGAWNGQADPVDLAPGATVTVRLPLSGGIEPVPARDLYKLVKGIGLRIDGSNVTFDGNVMLDNVRVEGLPPPSAEDTGAFPVGTFGGFVRSSGPEIPSRNGFLTFGADSTVQGHALRWAKLGAGGGDLVVGTAWFGNALPSFSSPALVFHDWVTLEARQDLLFGGSASVLLSRAFPAARYTSGASAFTWNTPLSRLTVVQNGAIASYGSGTVDLGSMSEPWILVEGAVPVLITFEKRPRAASLTGGGVRFDFSAAMGSVQVMPLYGLRRGAFDINDAIVQSRFWLQRLAAFPTGMTETSAVDEASGTVTITDRYTFAEIADDWGTRPLHAAAIPPAVHYAGLNGYPVGYANPAIATQVATYFGPFAYVEGDLASFTIPLAAALTREPIPLRVNNAATTRPIRAELERILTDEVPSEPQTYWLGNDSADAGFLCDAWSTLLPGSAARAKAQTAGPRLAENTFLSRSIAWFEEPVTGQRYLAPTSYPASVEPFDKEWNNGRQLAALARCAEKVDLDLARGLWPKILGTYRYDRIFLDWATGSVTSSTEGFTELADGMHFAWDGMLGVGRLARKLGDEATWRDAAYRTARQQLALYDAWFQAQWTRDIDYGIGHITDAKLPASEVETRGAIDGWVEDFGLATLEFKSFWQTANYLYFDVPAQLSLYRDRGLEDRVRTLEYQIMPSLHPSWADGNAFDAVDQRYYGSNYTAAHLAARALLFHDDPAALFSLYQGAQGTEASRQWYAMEFHGLAGPTLLAVERARAPVVEAPVASLRLAAASWDAKSGKVSLDFQPLSTGTLRFRTRAPGGAFTTHAVKVKAGVRTT